MGEVIYEQKEVSWSLRGEVISLVRNVEVVLCSLLFFCFFLSGKPWPQTLILRFLFTILQLPSFSVVLAPRTCPSPTLELHNTFV